MLTSKGVLPEKDVLERAAKIKWFEYLDLGKELITKTSVAEKQYQKVNKIFKSDDEEEKPVTMKKEKLEITHWSKLV